MKVRSRSRGSATSAPARDSFGQPTPDPRCRCYEDLLHLQPPGEPSSDVVLITAHTATKI